MKFVLLIHANGQEIAVNRDSIAYAESCGKNTKIYMLANDQQGHFNSILIKESYDDVVAKLNAK